MFLGAAGTHLTGVGEHIRIDVEGLLRVEAQSLLQCGDFVAAQCRTMDLAGVLLVGGRPADDGAQGDDGRPVRFSLGCSQCVVETVHVLAVFAAFSPVHALGVPAIGFVARQDVLGEGDVRVVFDGDVVLVVDHHEVAQFLVAGQGRGLRGHAFLQVAVGRDHPDGVVERAGAGRGIGVEHSAQAALRVGKTDCGGQALAQRASGDLDAVGVAVFGVAGGLGAPGPQGLEVIQFQAVAGEEQLDVERQRRMSGGEDKTVTANPVRVSRIVAHHLLEQQIRRRSQAHGGTGVTIANLLNGVGGQDADGIHCLAVRLAPGKFLLFQMWHVYRAPLCTDYRRFPAPDAVFSPLQPGFVRNRYPTCTNFLPVPRS